MGYPMTFRRLVNRNGLADGDYHVPPAGHRIRLNLDDPGLTTMESLREAQWPHVVKRLREYEDQLRLLAGDLRRLEIDSVDEVATCRYIAQRTGVDPDVVAVVLKEFIAW